MTKKMIIDATQPEETRVAVLNKDRLESYDFDSAVRKQIKGNIFLAKVTRVEPSLQACFVEYGGNRQGFLAFTEIHPDYYRIPIEDREALLAEEAEWEEDEEEGEEASADPARAPQPELAEQPDSPVAGDETTPIEAVVETMPLEAERTESVSSEAMDNGNGEELPVAPNMTEVERDNTIETAGGAAEEEDGDTAQRARRFGRLRRRYKVQEVIKRRQIMLVQATKEERGQKGAAMTTYISLPGRYCVLMPNSPRGGGVSRKITDPNARRKMKELLSELQVPDGMSVILRTAGMTRSRPEIKRDLEYLLGLWDEIRRETMKSVAPALIYEEADIFKRSIRDLYNRDTLEVIVSGEIGYSRVRKFMRQMVPAHAKRVTFYRDPLVPVFQRFNIEKQIADIFNPRVELRSGGYIIINPTEALVSIDVNSGRATRERHIDDTALKTNMEAAEEIARQLRLRDLGGLVVIDFIDMDSNRHNAKVERRLRESMAEDRARIEIGRISGFGLLELSRQRLHPSLTETHFEHCPHCAGTGLIRTTESAAVVVIRAIEAEAVKGRSSSITASVPQAVALYILNHKRDEMLRIEEYFGCRVAVRVDEKLKPNDVELQTEKGIPTPKTKVDQLPVPFVEGDDQPDVEDELEGEPLMELGDGRLDDDREGFDDIGGDERRGGRNNNRRGGGRNGNNNRRGGRGRNRRPAHLEDTLPESADPHADAVSILITEGAPVDGFDDNSANPDAVRNPSEGRERGNRGGRNRRGGRHPYRRRDGRDNGRERNNGDQPQQAQAQPTESATAPQMQEQRAPEPANTNGGEGETSGKRGWWQKLVE
jgi:ribonuclease E